MAEKCKEGTDEVGVCGGTLGQRVAPREGVLAGQGPPARGRGAVGMQTPDLPPCASGPDTQDPSTVARARWHVPNEASHRGDASLKREQDRALGWVGVVAVTPLVA